MTQPNFKRQFFSSYTKNKWSIADAFYSQKTLTHHLFAIYVVKEY